MSMKFVYAAVAAAALLAFAAGSVAQDEREPEEPTVFPEGEYRDEAFYLCTACHGSDLVRAQGHTRERWAEVLKIMVDRHNMAELEGEDLDKTLDYLAKAFPPKGRVYSNPFLNRRQQ
ncbi:hypothetical protein FNB15_14840 [Ferrovibrio terrae]|jgi:hypothetical protein|uniref:Cytochrome c n=1 Tax=Ferrovibrio terrae TaxID=2594003 RepID=A0A516H407_9PROT|nr:hypothetical protein [Ferrovibrio terrae]QDO98475.1 hypothetical protein FNB15_14840 [Ferrovibrio terrae]